MSTTGSSRSPTLLAVVGAGVGVLLAVALLMALVLHHPVLPPTSA